LTSTLESRLDQVKHESEQLRLNILEKDKIIDAAGKVSSELTTDLKDTVPDSEKEEVFGESEQFPGEAPELVSTAINTDFILDDDEQNNSYVSELIDVIRELNLQVQTKDEQLESIQEELRSRSIWNKGDLHIIAEEEPESPPLNYELDMATSSASSAKIETNVVAVASEQQPNGLEDQERRTRIALLENQQAELETEIRLLKQCSETGEKINQNLTANLEAQHIDRGSSGCGDSLESNPELDALSKMVVDKVLEKIKADPKGQLKLANGSGNSGAGDEKSGMAVTQMRYLLQRERNLVSELQVSAFRLMFL